MFAAILPSLSTNMKFLFYTFFDIVLLIFRKYCILFKEIIILLYCCISPAPPTVVEEAKKKKRKEILCQVYKNTSSAFAFRRIIANKSLY